MWISTHLTPTVYDVRGFPMWISNTSLESVFLFRKRPLLMQMQTAKTTDKSGHSHKFFYGQMCRFS
jgi:hypothetical protein